MKWTGSASGRELPQGVQSAAIRRSGEAVPVAGKGRDGPANNTPQIPEWSKRRGPAKPLHLARRGVMQW